KPAVFLGVRVLGLVRPPVSEEPCAAQDGDPDADAEGESGVRTVVTADRLDGLVRKVLGSPVTSLRAALRSVRRQPEDRGHDNRGEEKKRQAHACRGMTFQHHSQY